MTYLDDIIDGSVAPLLHRDASVGQIFNISTTERTSAMSMATQVKELTGTKSEIVVTAPRPNDTQSEDIDVSKAKRLLGWEARTSFAEGLKKTLPWIKTQL
jgi:UDP-glucose 4-epimerase